MAPHSGQKEHDALEAVVVHDAADLLMSPRALGFG